MIDGTLLQALSGILSAILSGLLVVLYRQQKNVLERQEKIMEVDYKPILSYDNCSIEPANFQTTLDDSRNIAHEAPKFDAHNHGKGKAMNIKSEIVVYTDIEPWGEMDKLKQDIKSIVGNLNPTRSVRREDGDLKNPDDMLSAGDEATFWGESFFLYQPTENHYESFQIFDPEGVDSGDFIAATIVVTYEDVLGNSYTDLPHTQIMEYQPNAAMNEFPVLSGPEEGARYREIWDIE